MDRHQPGVQTDNVHATRFIRAGVTDDNWIRLQSAARRTGVTITSYVSQSVGQTYRR